MSKKEPFTHACSLKSALHLRAYTFYRAYNILMAPSWINPGQTINQNPKLSHGGCVEIPRVQAPVCGPQATC